MSLSLKILACGAEDQYHGGIGQRLAGLLDLLGTVRLVMVLTPSENRRGRPRCASCDLVPDKAPFVYTDEAS
ncbi:MAG: hypothetical protein ACE5E4_05245 [Candidatus Binatia bacterium]